MDHAPEGVDLTKLQLFGKIEDELTMRQDAKVILHGDHILMPNSLHQRAISIAHEGHQGFIKTTLLCEKVWFPKIDHYVKEMINQQVLCQASGPKNHPDLLQMSPPSTSRTMVHCPHGLLWSISDRKLFVRSQ